MTKAEMRKEIDLLKQEVKNTELDLNYYQERKANETMEPLKDIHDGTIEDLKKSLMRARKRIEDYEFHLEQMQLKEWQRKGGKT